MTKPTKQVEPEQPIPSAEEVLRRLLNTPPDPFTPSKDGKAEKAEKAEKKTKK